MSTSTEKKRPLERFKSKFNSKFKIMKAVLQYEPENNLFDAFKEDKIVTVEIPLKYLTQKEREEGKIFGTDIYTDNSDLISACQHCGVLNLREIYQNQSSIENVLVDVKIHPPLEKYKSTFKNNIRSRGWSFYKGNSYSIESIKINEDSLMKYALKKKKLNPKVEPTTTELEFARFGGNSVVYNMSQDPCFKYSLNLISDKTINVEDFTSYRFLNSKEILFFETKTERFEISGKEMNSSFRFAKIKTPKTLTFEKLDFLNENSKLPLQQEYIEIIEDNLKWEDFKWGKDSVEIKNKKYFISNLNFFKIKA
eukprot:gene10901-3605_t